MWRKLANDTVCSIPKELHKEIPEGILFALEVIYDSRESKEEVQDSREFFNRYGLKVTIEAFGIGKTRVTPLEIGRHLATVQKC